MLYSRLSILGLLATLVQSQLEELAKFKDEVPPCAVSPQLFIHCRG